MNLNPLLVRYFSSLGTLTACQRKIIGRYLVVLVLENKKSVSGAIERRFGDEQMEGFVQLCN